MQGLQAFNGVIFKVMNDKEIEQQGTKQGLVFQNGQENSENNL